MSDIKEVRKLINQIKREIEELQEAVDSQEGSIRNLTLELIGKKLEMINTLEYEIQYVRSQKRGQ